MSSKSRVLIIGFGKMGRIHAKHLSSMGAAWSHHDPFVPEGVGLDRISEFTHAIIATPIPTHYEVYRRLDAFPGRILIEKPVVADPEHLSVLDDERVFPGMCERYNPAVQELKAGINSARIVALEFCRSSVAGNPADVGIHDLDLFCHLLELTEAPGCWWEGDEFVAAAAGVTARFRWPCSPNPRRTIGVTTRASRFEVNLVIHPAEAGCVSRWPIHRELTAFLEGKDRPDARVSHRLLISCLEASNNRIVTD
jgi:predicted dehydrogenase